MTDIIKNHSGTGKIFDPEIVFGHNNIIVCSNKTQALQLGLFFRKEEFTGSKELFRTIIGLEAAYFRENELFVLTEIDIADGVKYCCQKVSSNLVENFSHLSFDFYTYEEILITAPVCNAPFPEEDPFNFDYDKSAELHKRRENESMTHTALAVNPALSEKMYTGLYNHSWGFMGKGRLVCDKCGWIKEYVVYSYSNIDCGGCGAPLSWGNYEKYEEV